MYSANDTLLLDGPVVRGPAARKTGSRTADLTRIVRHALKAAAASGPLDRAIRRAAQTAGPLSEAGADVDDRARLLALQIDALLTRRTAAPQAGQTAELRGETVQD